MRVLFFGDLDASGFGTVTSDLGRALLAIGEDVRFISQNAMGSDLPEPYRSRTVDVTSLVTVVDQLTGSGGAVGSADIIGDLLRGQTTAKLASGEPWGEWKPDAAIMLGDTTAARMLVLDHWESFATLRGRLFHYVPIEGVELPPMLVRDLWSLVSPVAMSEFGAREIEKVTGVRPPMVYHGVDSEAFHPVNGRTPVRIAPPGKEPMKLTTKLACKQMWAAFAGMPGMAKAKWILRTDRHMPRKRYNSMLRSLARVLYEHTDVVLWIHARQFDQGGYLPDTLSKIPGSRPLTKGLEGENPVPDLWALFGRPYPQVVLTNQNGIGREALVALYNAADLYVSTSAEGFGLTIAESIACGVPVVGIDFSAVPEVIGPAGVTVPVAFLVENMYDHYWAAIDEPELTKKVEFLITHQSRREELGRKGPAHVAANFRWDTAAAQFADLIHAAAPVEVAA